MTTLVVDWTGLRAGDIMEACGTSQSELTSGGGACWGTDTTFHELKDDQGSAGTGKHGYFTMWCSGAHWVMNGGDPSVPTPGVYYKDQFWRVQRSDATVVQQKSTLWNGKCRLCGKGTYQGFTSLEHEGGGCK